MSLEMKFILEGKIFTRLMQIANEYNESSVIRDSMYICKRCWKDLSFSLNLIMNIDPIMNEIVENRG